MVLVVVSRTVSSTINVYILKHNNNNINNSSN